MEENKNSLLIVDDEKSNLKVLTHILGQEYSIYTASNGIDAIEKAKDYTPDLILLDILMPEMDGYQTLSEIKKNDKIKNIPVIFITGLDSDEDEEKGLALEAVDYITKPFSPIVVKLRVRNQIQIITQMRTIERLGMIDQLTNLPNRRFFDKHLNIEWKQAIREKTNISLLMLDLDNFKKVNDKYGHQQGDLVLQVISVLLHKSLKRPGDFSARWGGEEFVILLSNTSAEGAIEIAETIRRDVEANLVQCDDGPGIKITISIGVTSITPVVGSSIDEFISNADKGLYSAKQAGRNKVVFCP